MFPQKNIADLQVKKIREEQAFRDRVADNDRHRQHSSIVEANVQSEARAEERRNLRMLTVEAREHAIQDMLVKVRAIAYVCLCVCV